MAQTVYLNNWEQKKLYNKMLELNIKLTKKGMKNISKESQIVHRILELTIDKVELSENGTIILKE